MKLDSLRRISQIAVLAVTLTGIIVGTTGVIYPYFFCYSNPWDVGNCPLGIMEHGFVDIQISFWSGLSMLFYLAGFLMLMGLLLGRMFCGWACPMGLLQDITRKFKISDRVRRKLKPKIDPRFKNVKYLILLAIPITAYLSKDLFYTNLCPVGGVTGTIPTLLFYPGEWLLGSSFTVKITSIILFFILVILVTRGWCKYLCPVGALLAPWNKLTPIKITRDEKACTSCGLCEKKCPMDIKDIGKKPDSECVLCGRCVTNCNFNSLRLGPAPFSSKKLMAVWTVLLLLSVAMLAGGAFTEGYGRADKINSLPCLGCLALDPYRAAEWRVSPETQPMFVAENLSSKPVFLHYRTDVCPGCDEMEPHIAVLEAQYGEDIQFIHINLDHATDEQDASYDIYDFAGTPEARFGVPMFVSVMAVMNGTVPEIQYNTQYGSSSDQGETKRLELETTIQAALSRHDTGSSPIIPVAPTDATVFAELFVDMGCVNCYKSEEALVELEADEDLSFVTFITDAPGESGTFSSGRENAYAAELVPPSLGHPWVIFAGGPGEEMGALTTDAALSAYRAQIAAADLAPVNLSVAGAMSGSGGTLFANITLTNLGDSAENLRTEAFLVERSSRWLNLQGDPIPNAFVDLLANSTFDIPAGGAEVLNISWTGNDAVLFSDMRMGNTAMKIAVWKGENLVTSKTIVSSEPDVLYLTSAESTEAALPNNTANFTFTLYNYQDSAVDYNLSVDKPVGWNASLSTSSVSVPALGNMTFSLTVTGTNTTSADPIANFTVRARGVLDPTAQAYSRVQAEVKDDITPPIVLVPEISRDGPGADQLINITVTVGDNTGIQSVKLSYFSCTPEACSPYFTVDMNLTTAGGNEYLAGAYPVGLDHTDFHYKIIATDYYGNTIETSLYDVNLEPVEEDTATEITEEPKWIGVVLLVIFAVIAIIIALSGRERKEQPPAKEVHGKS